MFSRMWQSFVRALVLEYAPAYHFGCCQWQRGARPPLLYLIYRWLVCLTVTGVAISSFACQELPRLYRDLNIELNYFKWFIYLTNWGYILIAVQAALALILVYRNRNDKLLNISCEESESPVARRARTPLLCRVYWVTHTVATDLAFVISLIYWTMVHDPKIHEINVINVLVHGGNSLLMLCELMVTAHPFRAAHAVYGAGAGLAYGFFSAVYWAVGGTDRIGLAYIYPSLNWEKPGEAVGFVCVCAVVMSLAHMLAAGAGALRVRIAQRLSPALATSRADRLVLPTH